MNSGIMRTIEIKATRGSIVWAQPPVAISGLAATSMECTIGCVVQALSQALPTRGAATPFSVLNTVFAGFDARPEFQSSFINYVWGFGGLGAVLTHDGANVAGSPYTASTQNIPAELQERRYPVLWHTYECLQDSGGPGRTRGGTGLRQYVEFPYVDGTISCIGDRERFGPPGIFGGAEGATAGLVINHQTEKERNIGIFSVNEPAARGARANPSPSGPRAAAATATPWTATRSASSETCRTNTSPSRPPAPSTASSCARSTAGAWPMRSTRPPPTPCGRSCAPPPPGPSSRGSESRPPDRKPPKSTPNLPPQKFKPRRLGLDPAPPIRYQEERYQGRSGLGPDAPGHVRFGSAAVARPGSAAWQTQ